MHPDMIPAPASIVDQIEMFVAFPGKTAFSVRLTRLGVGGPTEEIINLREAIYIAKADGRADAAPAERKSERVLELGGCLTMQRAIG